MNTRTSTSVLPCPICFDEGSSKTFEYACLDPSHGICKPCLTTYIQSKVEESYMGTCPTIRCPCEHVCVSSGVGMKASAAPILNYNKWTKSMTELKMLSIKNKFDVLVNSLLLFFCGGCHQLKTLSLAGTPVAIRMESRAAIETALREREEGTNSFNLEFQKDLEDFENGLLSTEAFQEKIFSFYFPSLVIVEDKEAWTLFKNVLLCIDDPERQASLHIRYFRLRPRIWTPCCNQEHCFQCKIKNFHNGKTCGEHASALDNNILFCPSCNISLVKGDGCNLVTCVCGLNFSWSDELVNSSTALRFAELHPTNTAQACANILCEEQGELLRMARGWQSRHWMEVDRALLAWWRSRFSACPSQACLVVNNLREGALQAKTKWETVFYKDIASCKKSNADARAAIFEGMIGSASSPCSTLFALLDCKQKGQDLRWDKMLVSGQLWRQEHNDSYLSEINARESRSARQFLHLYGSQRIVLPKFISSTMMNTRWNEAATRDANVSSDSNIEYSRCGSSVSIQGYRATLLTDVPNSESSITTIRIDTQPSTDLFIGIIRKSKKWGLFHDTEQSIVRSDAEVVAQCRPLRCGDLVTLVAHFRRGTLEITLNDSESTFKICFPAISNACNSSTPIVVRGRAGTAFTILPTIAVSFILSIQNQDHTEMLLNFLARLKRINKKDKSVESSRVEALARKWARTHNNVPEACKRELANHRKVLDSFLLVNAPDLAKTTFRKTAIVPCMERIPVFTNLTWQDLLCAVSWRKAPTSIAPTKAPPTKSSFPRKPTMDMTPTSSPAKPSPRIPIRQRLSHAALASAETPIVSSRRPTSRDNNPRASIAFGSSLRSATSSVGSSRSSQSSRTARSTQPQL